MGEIRLPRLAERTPVKLAVSVMPDLHSALSDYARLYAETYGKAEKVEDLIPAMLVNFLESDRAFARARGRTA